MRNLIYIFTSKKILFCKMISACLEFTLRALQIAQCKIRKGHHANFNF